VGNFDPVRTRKRIEDCLGMIRKPKDAFVSPQLRHDRKQLTAHWDASTRHLFLAWSMPSASSTEHAALSVAADLLTTRISMDHDLSRWAKMPLVTCDVEGMFLVSIQVKPEADIEAVRDKLMKMVAQLSKVDGSSDVQVALTRQRITQGLHPGSLSRFFSNLRGSQLIDRTNQELQRINKIFACSDLKAYSDRVEAVSSRGVREAVAHHLTSQEAVVVRVEPSN
jgi:predicted Zn-dependent peptidase